MKTNKKYLLLSLVAVLAVAGLSFSATTSAQSVPTLGCAVAQASVGMNQAANLTATGGTGTYSWSIPGYMGVRPVAANLTITFALPGNYAVVLASGVQVVTCTVVVTAVEFPDPGTPAAQAIPSFPNTGGGYGQ